MTTRRNFITGCSVLAAAVALKPATLLAASDFRSMATFDLPGLTAFGREVGTPFPVLFADGPAVPLCLVDARPLTSLTGTGKPGEDAAGEHRFSLLFRGPKDASLRQDTYTFEHARLGRLAMFIVPVLPRQERHQYYEAVFNRHSGPVV